MLLSQTKIVSVVNKQKYVSKSEQQPNHGRSQGRPHEP